MMVSIRITSLVALLLTATAAPAATPLSSLTDPPHPGCAPELDILAADVAQDGGRLTFTMTLRGTLPAELPQPDDILAFLWYVDADGNPATGQPHGAIGSEFNVRADISRTYGGSWVDVTGELPGGGDGQVSIDGSTISVSCWLGQIADPETFNWSCATFAIEDGVVLPGNDDTPVAGATPLPYTPPAVVIVTTPILELCPTGPATGQLQVELRDADGAIIPNAGHLITYHSTNEAVATVDANGLVTAVAPPAEHWQTPYIEVWGDGLMCSNSAVIRVNSVDVGVTHETLAEGDVRFCLPDLIEGVDLGELTERFEVVRATGLAYTALATGVGPDRTAWGPQWFVLDVAADPATGVCGASGNPIRLGWTWGQAVHNSCYIVNDPENRRPQWFVMWHELGHNYTASCNAFNMYLWTPSATHNTAYGEGLASLAALWAWRWMFERPTDLGPVALGDIDNNFCDTWLGFQDALAAYRAGGSDYDTIDPDVVDGILMEMWAAHGIKTWFDLFSTFLPSPAPIPVAIDTVEKQATWFVAAMCVSTGEDLRDRFTSDYGFPLDLSAWDEIHAVVADRIAARDFAITGVDDGADPGALSRLGSRLWPVAPNPFNPRTTIGFTLARAGRVELAVYDVRGRLVRTLLDGPLAAGPHAAGAIWDGRDGQGREAPSGAYVIRLTDADGVAISRKMTLLR